MTKRESSRSLRTRRRQSKAVSFAEASRLARTLPGVSESTSYGTPALKVEGKLFARLKEDGETLVLKMDVVSREFLLRAEPELFYLTDHYRDYPWILLRLPRVTVDRLAELLEDAWRLAAPRRLVAGRAQPPSAAVER
jgi:hypothetical protein